MMKNDLVNYLLKPGFLAAAVVTLFAWTPPVLSDTSVTVRGNVVTRALVRDAETNLPVLAEYDDEGGFIGVLQNESIGKLTPEAFSRVRIMRGVDYAAIVQNFKTFLETHETGLARGALVLTRETYLGDGYSGHIARNTQGVLIRNPETGTPLLSNDPVMFQAPIDLRDGIRRDDITAAHKSVLLGPTGEVLAASVNRVGFRTAFWVPEDDVTNPEDEDRPFPDNDEIPIGPVVGAEVDSIYSRVSQSTGEQGEFSLPVLLPPCLAFNNGLPIDARVAYRRFNPESAEVGTGYHYFQGRAPIYCSYTEYLDVNPLLAAGVSPVLYSMDALLTPPFAGRGVIPIDVIKASGVGLMENPDGTPVELGDNTLYGTTGMGEAANESGDRHTIAPLGLLESITVEDLKQTDLYVFRAATGDLVMERRGLRDRDLTTGDGEAKFRINLTLPGPKAFTSAGALFNGVEAFQQESGISEDYQGKTNANFLKPGETVQLIAVNRVTGYVGQAYAPIAQDQSQGGQGLLSVQFDQLTLRPPELKIHAQRVRDDLEDYTIGFEGAGLTRDERIQVFTQWTGAGGMPLPAELPGYTGRLTVAMEDPRLARQGTKVGFFDITPGSRWQVLRFNQELKARDHFYIHVVAQPEEDVADFSECGSDCEDTVLQYRPRHYVPIQVPIPNPEATSTLRLEAEATLTDDEPGNDIDPDTIEAVYGWAYRPEMQFTVYELNQLQLEQPGEGGEAETSDLLDNDNPVAINPDQQAELLYDLLVNQVDPLDLIGPNRELILELGGQQYAFPVCTPDDDEQTDDCRINLTQEELQQLLQDNGGNLALQIYLDTDPDNVLYDFAFLQLALGVDYDRDRKITYAPSDRTKPSKPFVFWVNDDFDVVSVKGQAVLGSGATRIQRCADAADAGTLIEEDGRQVCEEVDLYDNGRRNASFDSDSEINRYIESYRDLEDLFAVDLYVPKELLEEGNRLYLTSNGVEMNLFKRDGDGPADHLRDEQGGTAQEQVQRPRKYYLGPGGDRELHADDFDEEGRLKLLVEVIRETSPSIENPPALKLTLTKPVTNYTNDDILAEDHLYVDFRTPQDLYEHWTVGTGHDLEAPVAPAAELLSDGLDYSQRRGLELEQTEDQYIMFVHGWRMKDFERRRFAETAMKRLYWEGYKGRFGFFSWPTGWFEKPPYWTPEQEAEAAAADPQNYNRSEAKARRSAEQLFNLLAQLRNRQSSLHVTAHSMGNIVVSEALKLAKLHYPRQLVDTYVAMQSADIAQAFAPDAPEMNVSIPDKIREEYLFYLGLNQEEPFADAWKAFNLTCPDTEWFCSEMDFFDLPPNHFQKAIPNPRTQADSTWIRGDTGTTGTHYYSGIRNKVGRAVSFYNEVDYALNGWEFNQATKPDSGLSWAGWNLENPLQFPAWRHSHEDVETEPVRKVIDTYEYDPFGPFGEHDIPWALGEEVNGRGRPEVLAHFIPARSLSLGASPDLCAPGVPQDEDCASSELKRSGLFDARTGFGFTEQAYDHSAQFLNSHVERRGFWLAMLREMDLTGGVDDANQ